MYDINRNFIADCLTQYVGFLSFDIAKIVPFLLVVTV